MKEIKIIEKSRKKYSAEIKALYGSTKEYKQSEAKYANYSKEQKVEIFALGQKIFLDIANLIEVDPSQDEVQALIGKWREHISKYFYECTTPILKGLGKMYVEDPRFKKNIDIVKPGLAEFFKKAIDIYCLNNN